MRHYFQRNWRNIVPLLVVIWTALVFLPCLNNDFVNWDDDDLLYDHPAVQALTWENVASIFSRPVIKTYTPLTLFTFALEYSLFGRRAAGYHFVNMVLHLAVVFLVYVLALRLRLGPFAAGAAALVFGIHPLHVESVAWISARKDVLSGVFYLLALLSYLSYLASRKKGPFLWTLAWGGLSMLAKPVAYSLPVVLLSLDWYEGRKLDLKCFLEKIPFAFYILPLLLWMVRLNREAIFVQNPFPEKALIWIWTLSFYPVKFIFPLGLSPVYELPLPVSLYQPSFALAFIVGVLALSTLYFFRKQRLYVLSWLVFFFAIFANLKTSDIAATGIVADRFMYLPSLGFCLLLGWLVGRIAEMSRNDNLRGAKLLNVVILSKISLQVVLGIFLMFSVVSVRQIRVWRDSEALWNDVLQDRPYNVTANINLADHYLKQGIVSESVAELCRKVLTVDPDMLQAHVNLGNVLAQMGQYEQAKTHSRRALELEPDHAVAHINLGNALIATGRPQEAIAHYRQAETAEFRDPGLHYNLATAFLTLGERQQAAESLRQALVLDPGFAAAARLYEKIQHAPRR